MDAFLQAAMVEADELTRQKAQLERNVDRARAHVRAQISGLLALEAELCRIEEGFVERQRCLWELMEHLEALEARLDRKVAVGGR